MSVAQTKRVPEHKQPKASMTTYAFGVNATKGDSVSLSTPSPSLLTLTDSLFFRVASLELLLHTHIQWELVLVFVIVNIIILITSSVSVILCYVSFFVTQFITNVIRGSLDPWIRNGRWLYEYKWKIKSSLQDLNSTPRCWCSNYFIQANICALQISTHHTHGGHTEAKERI